MANQIYFFTIGLTFLMIASATSVGEGVGSFQINSNSNTNISTEIKKPTLIRTELKVSRSLNPDKVQTLSIRTNTGDLATIIVKKRDGKVAQQPFSNDPGTSQAYYDVSNQFSRGEVRRGFFGPMQVVEQSQLQPQYQPNVARNVYDNWSAYSPYQPQAQMYRNPYETYRFAPHSPNDLKSLNLINSFMQHVEQIETNQRQFGDGNMKNDRRPVHIPVPTMKVNEARNVDIRVPSPVTINSETVYVKNQNSNPIKKGRSLASKMEIGSDGVPLIHGVRVPDDEADKTHTWRNARVINGELVPYEKGYAPPKTVEYGQLIYPVKKSADIAGRRKSIGPFTTLDNFSTELLESENEKKSIGPFSVQDNIFTARSNQAQDSNIGPFTVSDNSRASNSKLIDYIKRINDQELRKDYFAGRANKELKIQPKIQRRMLAQPGNQNFPSSSRYTLPNDEPVLQYAHPEYGVQVAKVGSQNVEPKKAKLEFYSKSKPPTPSTIYQIEPSSLNTREYYNPGFPGSYPYNYGYVRRVRQERPFWMKITEQVRDSFQNGVTQVQHMASPIVDPIMEAGHKISKNLGFVRGGPDQGQLRVNNQEAQEKVGVVSVGTPMASSIFFPALGLISGAALSLGAVAVGRYFDVSSLLQRSQNGEIANDQQRAFDAIHQTPTTTLYLVENKKGEDNKRSRRNLDNNLIEFYENSSPSSPAHNFDTFLDMVASQSANKRRSKRNRRSLESENSLGSLLQDIEQDIPKSGKLGFEQQIKNTNWANTPCAKKVFCEVMTHQSQDEVVLMEKKMYSLLRMMHPGLRNNLESHLSEVTEAIRIYDCSRFICYQN